MTLKQLHRYYGSQVEIGRALGLSRATVNQWFRRNNIPLGRQYQIELATGGKLKADSRAAA